MKKNLIVVIAYKQHDENICTCYFMLHFPWQRSRQDKFPWKMFCFLEGICFFLTKCCYLPVTLILILFCMVRHGSGALYKQGMKATHAPSLALHSYLHEKRIWLQSEMLGITHTANTLTSYLLCTKKGVRKSIVLACTLAPADTCRIMSWLFFSFHSITKTASLA